MAIDISNLQSALNTLKSSIETLDKYKNYEFSDMLEDSCVKRFEYTLEIARKTMKRILKDKYGKTEEELTVNNVFRFMQGYKYISDWETWRNYYEKRNNTAHEYNLAKAKVLLNLIPDFIEDTEKFINNIDNKLTDD